MQGAGSGIMTQASSSISDILVSDILVSDILVSDILVSDILVIALRGDRGARLREANTARSVAELDLNLEPVG